MIQTPPEIPPEVIEETIEIAWAGEALRGVLAYPAEGRPERGVVIAGPHPLLGGALENNVTGAAARGAERAGWLALRFAWREPDRQRLIDQMDRFWKTGRLDEDAGRLEELCAAMGTLSRLVPIRCVLGYSFGCWQAACLVGQLPFQLPVGMIAPTVHQHDFAPMRRHTAPKLLIAADGDFAVTPRQLAQEIEQWPGPLRLETLAGADHFFRNQEPTLERLIEEWLEGLAAPALATRREPPNREME